MADGGLTEEPSLHAIGCSNSTNRLVELHGVERGVIQIRIGHHHGDELRATALGDHGLTVLADCEDCSNTISTEALDRFSHSGDIGLIGGVVCRQGCRGHYDYLGELLRTPQPIL